MGFRWLYSLTECSVKCRHRQQAHMLLWPEVQDQRLDVKRVWCVQVREITLTSLCVSALSYRRASEGLVCPRATARAETEALWPCDHVFVWLSFKAASGSSCDLYQNNGQRDNETFTQSQNTSSWQNNNECAALSTSHSLMGCLKPYVKDYCFFHF